MTVHVDIVSAEREIFSGLAQIIVATGELGELGITPGHAPLLTALKPGQVEVTKADGEQDVYYIDGGMLEVQPNCVTVLADTAIRADSLDEQAAQDAKQRAQQALQARGEKDFDYGKAAVELARAAAQIEAIRKAKKRLK